MKAIIIEDEEYSQKTLKNMVDHFCEGVKIVAIADSVNEGVKMINQHQPDFIFLDIEMPEQNGFKLFEYFETPAFEVIFTTAYNQYALNAFKLSAIDYLLKPIDLDELRNAIDRVAKRKSFSETKQKLDVLKGNLNNLFHKLALPTGTGFIFVAISDIVRCEAQGNYTLFHLKKGEKVLVSKTLKLYDNLLSEFNFFRVNRADLVNLNFIREYGRHKSPTLTLADGKVLNLSPGRREGFLKKIENFS